MLTAVEQEEFEERAAIMEFDGRLPRKAAEAEAMRLIIAKRKNGNTGTSRAPKESRHGNPGGEFPRIDGLKGRDYNPKEL